MCMQARTHAEMHARTYTCTCTHTCTPTHTHRERLPWPSYLFSYLVLNYCFLFFSSLIHWMCGHVKRSLWVPLEEQVRGHLVRVDYLHVVRVLGSNSGRKVCPQGLLPTKLSWWPLIYLFFNFLRFIYLVCMEDTGWPTGVSSIFSPVDLGD